MRAERLGESWADWRCNVSAQEEQQFPYLLDRVPVEGDPLPDEFLRFGMFADGGKATNLDRPSYDHDHEPDRPVLHQQAGGGGAQPGTWSTGCGRYHRTDAWLRVRVAR
jgi:hypothetical protein